MIGVFLLALMQSGVPATTWQVAPAAEVARYRVSYGIFGEVADVNIMLRPGASGRVRAVGRGHGDVLGMGKLYKRIETDFATDTLSSTRWTVIKVKGNDTVTDTSEQGQPGLVKMIRKDADGRDKKALLKRTDPILDPLGLLLRLRLDPPLAGTKVEVLDGRALWRITLGPAVRKTSPVRGLRFDGKAEPLRWNGEPHPKKSSRHFSLWLGNDPYRTPLRLEVPLPVGRITAELASISRPDLAQSRARVREKVIRVLKRAALPFS